MAKKKKPQKPAKSQAPLSPERFQRKSKTYATVIARKPATEADRLAQFQAYYALGALLSSQLAKDATYGENILADYAEVSGIGKTNLNRAKRFAERYEEDKLQELAESGLTWSHIAHLAGVRDKVRRKRIQSQATRQKWTVARLQSEIKTGKADSKRSASGRRLEVSEDAEEAYRKIYDDGTLLLRRLQLTTETHASSVSSEVPEDLRNEMVELLNETIIVAKAAKKAMQ